MTSMRELLELLGPSFAGGWRRASDERGARWRPSDVAANGQRHEECFGHEPNPTPEEPVEEVTAHEPDRVEQPLAYPAERRPMVLVAEDSAAMRDLLTEVLEAEGCEVVGVASGGRALSEMTHRPPDLVITDLFMPGMTGFTLRSLMLKRPELARIPVIVLSAYWHRPSETLEVADVLTKPLNVDRLVESVRRLLPARVASAG